MLFRSIEKGVGKKKKFTVINPGVEIPKKSSNKINLRQKFKISSQSIVIGWLGRLSDIKNPLLVKEIARELPDQIFLIGGEGELRKDLEFDAPKNFYLLGWVKPERFWPMCDIALLTSKNEATPYALVEAASFGLPIITNNVGSVEDIVSTRNGILINNTKSFVKNIKTIASNPKLRRRLGMNSKIIYLKNFSVTNFKNTHKEIYMSYK